MLQRVAVGRWSLEAYRGTVPEAILEELYEHAPCGFLSVTLDGTIVRVNQTLLDWTGYSREAILGS